MIDYSNHVGEYSPPNSGNGPQALRFENASGDSPVTRIITAATQSAAIAYDEVFALKAVLASVREEERSAAALQTENQRAEWDNSQKALILALQVSEQVAKAAKKSEAQAWRQHRKQLELANQLKNYNTQLLTSTSWRITAPLRALTRLAMRS